MLPVNRSTNAPLANIDDTMVDVEAITETDDRYAQALAFYKQAKILLKSSVPNDSKEQPFQRVPAASSLRTHLDDLRLQKQYDQLELLSNYFEKLEQLAFDEKIYQGFDIPLQALPNSFTLNDHRPNTVQDRVISLQDRAKSLITNTELALVQARQRLKHEQSLLLDTQKRVTSQSPDIAVKLLALEATRDELQGWVGTSLAKCEQEQLSTGDLEDQQPTNSFSETGHDGSIDEEYERYVAMRTRLTRAVDELKTPISAFSVAEHETFGTESTDLLLRQASQPPNITHKTRSKPDYPGSKGEANFYPSLSQIHTEYLSNYHHEKILSTWATHLAEQAQAQDSRLLHVLSLLNHESHLLPNHPSPAIMERESKSIASTHQQVEIDRLLHAWAFASQSADDSLKEAVEAQIADANTALERARDHLVGLDTLDSMKREALDKT